MSSSRPSSKADVVTLMEPGGPFQTSHWTVRFLYKISCHGISIWYFAMDYLLSRFVSTTTYQQESEGLMYFAFQVQYIDSAYSKTSTLLPQCRSFCGMLSFMPYCAYFRYLLHYILF